MPVAHQFFDKTTSVTDKVFGVSPANRVYQIHGNQVVTIDEPFGEWIKADALVTRQPNLPIGVITADCAPILFQAEGVIAAAHAGWKGALRGILENTLEAMACPAETITAMIGPCIAQKSYEVSVGFEKPFLDNDEEAERFFMSGQVGKLHFDLAGYCAFRLQKAGINKVEINGIDTLTNTNFYSHRGGDGGRNLSAIKMRKK